MSTAKLRSVSCDMFDMDSLPVYRAVWSWLESGSLKRPAVGRSSVLHRLLISLFDHILYLRENVCGVSQEGVVAVARASGATSSVGRESHLKLVADREPPQSPDATRPHCRGEGRGGEGSKPCSDLDGSREGQVTH